MLAFRIFLLTIVANLLVYTGIVGTTHGWNFGPVFFNDILAMNWAGQFNMDFSCLLLLAGLWLAWRHQFSVLGIGLGLFQLVGGAPFLCSYLFFASLRAQGDMQVLLMGPERARA